MTKFVIYYLDDSFLSIYHLYLDEMFIISIHYLDDQMIWPSRSIPWQNFPLEAGRQTSRLAERLLVAKSAARRSERAS